MDNYGTARAAMAELAGEARDGSMNEDTTRLRVIDRVLMDGLGWRPGEITTEESGPDGYVDYALGRATRSLIVEAKAIGVSFVLPPGLEGRKLIDLRTLRDDQRTSAAIDQVTRYCQARGVALAVITNGEQYVAFYASRQDGVAPMRGQALCFHSLDDICARFNEFWSMLSRDGVAQRNLQRLLAVGNGLAAAPPKLADSIQVYPGFRGRTELETNLRMLGNAFVRDIESPSTVTDEFYRRCYCNTGALSQYALVSKEVLLDRYGATAMSEGVELAPVREKRGRLSPLLQGDIYSVMKSSPLIILGDVGVGKTMFLQHFLRIEGAEELKKSLVFYIDFGNKRSLNESFEDYVTSEITRQLLEEYGRDIFDSSFVRAVYNREVNQFSRGVFAVLKDDDPAAFRLKEAERLDELSRSADHLLRSLNHLRTQSTMVVVLDNVDQWSIEDQDRVFLIAQSLASRWPLTVFVSLRPETFHRSKVSGALSAYQLRVFTVSPPRIADVIHRRISFALEVAAEQSSEELPEALRISMADLASYLHMLDSSFQRNEELCEIVDNLSGGNVRAALSMVARFIGSPYVSTSRILEEASVGRRYSVPPHEVLRSTLLGDNAYFDPTRTEVANIFDLSSGDEREHFLLSAIVQLCREGSNGEHGFVDSDLVYETFARMGFTQEQIAFQLRRALEKRLLNGVTEDVGGPFRTSQLGAYSVLRLPTFFTYVDSVIVDTPIVDAAVRREIRDVRSFDERIARAQRFVDYLDSAWARSDALGDIYGWPVVSEALRGDMADAVERMERARR